MMSFILSDSLVANALGLPQGQTAAYNGVHTDTRLPMRNGLFVALHGRQFDGHDYLVAAHKAGATAAIVRRGTPQTPGLRLYEVEDTLVAYGRLANARRKLFPGPVIAITGQNGKTSTKEMVAAVLATRWRTHRTHSNDNNLVGVPKTILSAPMDAEALVVEAGANALGEIAIHRRVIDPDIAVVTNAGAGHLEGFGSVANVIKEKLELTRDVPTAIVGVVPNPLGSGATDRGAGRVITVGLTDSDLVPDALAVTADGRVRLTVGGHQMLLAARGRHQASNALFAWAIAEELGLDMTAVAKALESFELPGGRGQLQHAGKLSILNDSYNANPESFRAAIELAQAMRANRRLVFVAGTMKELGPDSDRFHEEIIGLLMDLKPDLLALVGDFVSAFGAKAVEYHGEVIAASDAVSIAKLLAERLQGDELVVLKGSRGAALEKVIDTILPSNTPS